MDYRESDSKTERIAVKSIIQEGKECHIKKSR
jgi:hypothetical protein